MEGRRMYESVLLQRLVVTTSEYPSWSVLRQAVQQERTVHIAVMVEPFLSYILDGKKSIESRFRSMLLPHSIRLSRMTLCYSS